MTMHFLAAAKAERLRLMAEIAKHSRLLEAVDVVLDLYQHFDDIDPNSPPAHTPSAKTEFDRRSSDVGGHPLPAGSHDLDGNGDSQARHIGGLAETAVSASIPDTVASVSGHPALESVPALQRAASEVSPSSDESATGREAGDALPATKAGAASLAPADPPRSEAAPREDAGQAAPALGRLDQPDRASLAPTKRERVRLLHEQHPDWSASDIAVALNLSRNAVHVHASMLGISLGVKGDGLGDRIATLHVEHPEWTAADMGRALDARSGSVANALKRRGIVLPKAPNPGRERKPDSVASRVEAYATAHPDATAGDIAKALGVDPSKVRASAATRNLTLRKLSHEERSARQREVYEAPITNEPTQRQVITPASAKPSEASADDGAESRRRKHGEPEREVALAAPPAAPAQTVPDRPVFDVGDPDADYVHPSVAKYGTPNAKWFRLRRADGQWLHLSGHGFTTDKNDGWIGRIGQLRNIRASTAHPDAKGLQIVAATAVQK